MTIKTIFIAEDGTEFYDEGTCIEHENNIKLSSIEDQYDFYDSEGRQTNKFPETFYIAISTQRAADILNEYINFIGYGTPWENIGVLWSQGNTFLMKTEENGCYTKN